MIFVFQGRVGELRGEEIMEKYNTKRKHIKERKRTTMKELPSGQGPYERCCEKGPGVLSDAELLSVIIRTGTRDQTSLELAQEILLMDGGRDGIGGLCRRSLEELMAVRGIGKVKAAQLLCIGELSRGLWRSRTVRDETKYREPEQIAGYYMEALRRLEQEHIYAMFFDNKQNLIRDVLLSKGTVNVSVISPREVLIEALKVNAVRFALIHNHPSGDPSPSREDCLMTKRIKEAGAIMGIALLDHIIIGDNVYISFKERGIL